MVVQTYISTIDISGIGEAVLLIYSFVDITEKAIIDVRGLFKKWRSMRGFSPPKNFFA